VLQFPGQKKDPQSPKEQVDDTEQDDREQPSPAETATEAASRVFRSPYTIQGWRPTSAAIQPNWLAARASGMDRARIFRNHRLSNRVRRHRKNRPSPRMPMKYPPRITMLWKDTKDSQSSAPWGTVSGGKSSSPLTGALMSPKVIQLRRCGISMTALSSGGGEDTSANRAKGAPPSS